MRLMSDRLDAALREWSAARAAIDRTQTSATTSSRLRADLQAARNRMEAASARLAHTWTAELAQRAAEAAATPTARQEHLL